ncbi:MAG: endopeptidase La [Deltaproteobacteria bacterium]|nr:endopeptidase La [Deltaproteobacteria bacterium]
MSAESRPSTRKGFQGRIVPAMFLREVVMFPGAIVPLFVGRKASIQAIEASLAGYDKTIFLVTQQNPNAESPAPEELFEVGVLSKILQMLRLPDGTIKVLFEGLGRATVSWLPSSQADVILARAKLIDEHEPPSSSEAEALIRGVHETLGRYTKINPKLSQESSLAMSSIGAPGRLADAVAPHLKIGFDKKQEILEVISPLKRLELVYGFLQQEIDIFNLEKKIKARVKKQMERNHKEYFLGEQIKAIQKEMGRETDPKAELDALEARMKEKNLPDQAREKGLQEIRKLRQISPQAGDYSVLLTYVEWILALPWNEVDETAIDIAEAAKRLDEDHYGLEKPKERILEYLAVQNLVTKMRGPILCFVGPPGVGKTSLAKSIARGAGREFVRLSLGGVRDEAEIRGHRRTYVGALPGKIIQSLKRVHFNNPVFCLDEVDKMSTDFRGDPSSALLEVLDPEQNKAFGDHYLDLDYDLSRVFFITTANSLHGIPLPLQDRMEIITLPGYLETEKMKIAQNFLIPKQIREHGLKPENISLSPKAVQEIIRCYTRESGVRNLERELASICRKVARKLVESNDFERTVHIPKSGLTGFLGVPKFRYGEREAAPQIGVATGLAYTQTGGELLLVEVALMPGSGKIEITGKLGEVMQESAKAALSYVRSRAEILGLKLEFYKEIDVHIHVPEGATPKDGPSAGITLCTSLVSALLARPVRNDLAMTGEITLRGRVLPIGGLREKLLAARRGLVSKVLIPAENERDLKEVPESVKKGLTIVPVKNMDQVLCEALVDTTPETLFCTREAPPLFSLRLLREDGRPTAQ